MEVRNEKLKEAKKMQDAASTNKQPRKIIPLSELIIARQIKILGHIIREGERKKKTNHM